ncbi:MAG: lysophospholipase [Rubrivivax sp.]|nr:lysophospholipase [Rubrivivax sp.]
MPTATLPDGTPLHWLQAGDVSGPGGAHVLLVHGLGEHSGRYAELTHRLLAAGHAVSAYDHRGHGLSGGPRGGIPRPDSLLDDLGQVIDLVHGHSPRPLVLLGHSMGGAVAARFVAEGLQPAPAAWFRPVQGLVLSSPALAADLNPWQQLLLALGRLAPDLPAGNGLQPGWISRDPAVVAAYRADPLVHDRITPRLARFILESGALVRRLAPRWSTPTLLMWAGADRCVAPRGSAEWAAAVPPQLLQARCFESLYHEIFNEPQRAEVFDALLLALPRLLAHAIDTSHASRTSDPSLTSPSHQEAA